MHISVRELVEFIKRSGDITPVNISSSRALAGTKAHQKIQKQAPDYYTAEVPVRIKYEVEAFDLVIGGRIDGIIEEDENLIIDEIKSTTRSIEDLKENDYPVHWSQVETYGYMYALINGLQEISVQLTYIHTDQYTIKKFEKKYDFIELETKFKALIDEYILWAQLFHEWEEKKFESISKVKFPFHNYRKGQKKLLNSVYKSVLSEEKLYLRAPTGTGKTIGTLFPTIKAIEKNKAIKQIFYLTAKTIGREVAESTLALLTKEGLQIKGITLTAKEKICLMEEVNCDAEVCPYAKGHYDRVNSAIFDVYNNCNRVTREMLLYYAKIYRICPFEFQLDLALYSDVIICDYNYVFDPRASLKRFFQEHSHYVFLIDEAHNLADRARDMFSAEINREDVVNIREKAKGLDLRLSKYLLKIEEGLIEKEKLTYEAKGFYCEKGLPDEIIDYSRGAIHRIEHVLTKNKSLDIKKELTDFYFMVHDLVKKSEFYDEQYITYYENKDKKLKMKLFCQNPSFLLREALGKAKSSIVFSATLLPLDYYVKLLGGTQKNYGLILESPFKQENLSLSICHTVSTRYVDREKTYDPISNLIYDAIKIKKGNYLIFFPSYAYLNEIKTRLFNKIDQDEILLIEQTKEMSEVDKENFLESFQPQNEKSLIGLAVLGGVFGEGIDLTGERLDGVIIVGVGLPGINDERNLIRDYYKDKYEGYKYAYMYPGMNKVMQAVGRVIRTEEDKGMVLLVDERYNEEAYKVIFPTEWSHAQYINNSQDLHDQLTTFWRRTI